MTETSGPRFLVDVPGEPVEDFCFVERTDRIVSGEDAVAYVLRDRTLFDPRVYDDPCTLVPLRPVRMALTNPDAGLEDEWWEPSEEGVEFWQLERVEEGS